MHTEVFEAKSTIGEGVSGEVYRAVEKHTQTEWAIKRSLSKCAELTPDYVRDVSALRSLNHPNIVSLHKIFLVKGVNYTVMPLAEGTLRDWVPYEKKVPEETIPPEQIQHIMFQLASAVAHCHRKRIYHRDLKPDNILRDKDGSILVCDFNMARRVVRLDQPLTPTVVTHWYRAPELLICKEKEPCPYTGAIDVWSMGCIFAELLCQTPLFDASSPLGVFTKQMERLGVPKDWAAFHEKPRLLPHKQTTLRKWMGKRIDECGLDLLERMLTWDPDKRITAEEILTHPYMGTNRMTDEPLDKADDTLARYHHKLWISIARQITENRRTQTINELFAVVFANKLNIETLFLGVSLLNAFCYKRRTDRSLYLMFSLGALLIASKLNDTRPLTVGQLKSADLTENMLLSIERDVFQELDGHCYIDTSLRCAEAIFEQHQDWDEDRCNLVRFLLLASLHDIHSLRYPPRVIANTAIELVFPRNADHTRTDECTKWLLGAVDRVVSNTELHCVQQCAQAAKEAKALVEAKCGRAPVTVSTTPPQEEHTGEPPTAENDVPHSL